MSQHDVAHLNPLTNVSTKFEVSQKKPGKDLSCRRPPVCPAAQPDTLGENYTPAAFKGCGVKIISYGSAYASHLHSCHSQWFLSKVRCTHGEYDTN